MKEIGFIELFSSCFSLDLYNRDNGAYGQCTGGTRGACESSGCRGDEKPGSIWFGLTLVVLHLLPLLSSHVWHFWTFHFFFSSSAELPAVVLLEELVDKCLEVPFCFASLSSMFMIILLIFLRAFVWGGMEAVWLRSREGHREFCVLSSVSQQYFPVTLSLTVFVAATCFPTRLNGRMKYILRRTLRRNTLLYPLCPATHILKTVRISCSSKSRHCTTLNEKPLFLNILMWCYYPTAAYCIYCTHLHSGFARNHHKSTSIVRHTHKHTLVYPSFESLSRCNNCCTQHS